MKSRGSPYGAGLAAAPPRVAGLAGLTFIFFSLHSPAHALEPRALFTSQDNIQRELQRSIDRATQSIDGAVFNISSRALKGSLERAARRGVTVRLLVDGHHPGRGGWSNAFIPGLELRQIAGRYGHGVMHHKFAIFDGTEVVTGSYNWTPGAQFVNHENVLFEEDPAVVGAYHHQFEQLWVQSFDYVRESTESRWYSARNRRRHKETPH